MTQELSGNHLLRLRWEAHVTRDEEGAPLVPPLFVLEQGPGVQIIDLRPRAVAHKITGYIPGSVFLYAIRIASLPRDGVPLVLVSTDGFEAAKVAFELQEEGRPYVAAMAGGIEAWRQLGLLTSRDPAGVTDTMHEPAARKPHGTALSIEQVRDHVGDPRAVHWIKLATMVTHGRFSCVDGRDERGLVTTPGGDAGEFLLLLAALEQATGAVLDDDAVARALVLRIDRFGDFYMHTDAHAFESLMAANDADMQNPEVWFDSLHHAEPRERDALLEHLVDPAHVGCGHIRLMLQRSDEYGIRTELVRSFLRSFYRLWWDGAPELTLTLLPGGHEEAAVVNVRVDGLAWGYSAIPLIAPACGGSQMFVNHPDVQALLRDAVIDFYLRGHGAVSVANEQAFRNAFAELGERFLTVTLGHLAQGLPLFEVEFAADGTFTVRG